MTATPEKDGPLSPPSAMPALSVCQAARASRDPRFDGRFFIGVLTTGIYCRPICPARMPKEENVRYYATAAHAQDAGFRPCRRCRPEAATRLPEWTLGSDTVLRALRMIESGYLNRRAVTDLAAELGVGERHLGRLFQEELGASPSSIAALCRGKLARSLLRSGGLKMADVAFHAGYGSVGRFNAEIKRIFQATPSELKKGRGREVETIRVNLPLRPPYDQDWMFEYLKLRALKGLEEVTRSAGGDWIFRRRVPSFAGDETGAWLSVTGTGDRLIADIPLVEEPLHELLVRIRRVFDLNADGEAIQGDLERDAFLGRFVRRRPGLRVPGAWDGFETGVRAVLGQQVSVVRGTHLADAMVERYGDGWFPEPDRLIERDIPEIGMPGQRGRAIALMAERARSGSLTLDECQDFSAVEAALLSIPGIGPWTANYIRMRVLKDPDAFPDNDWVVMKTLDATAAQSRRRAERWRPWRAYALMYVWYASSEVRAKQKREAVKE